MTDLATAPWGDRRSDRLETNAAVCLREAGVEEPVEAMGPAITTTIYTAAGGGVMAMAALTTTTSTLPPS